MLRITVPMKEGVDEDDNFVLIEGFDLELEHSLASLSKWESKFEKPFLGKDEKTSEEVMGYIEAMCLTPNVPPEVFQNLSDQNIEQINSYIDAKQTATWFSDTGPDKPNTEVVTAELIYYWLTTFKISWEVQHWHLNRLFTLIRVFDQKQTKPKQKMGQDDLARRREMNRARLAKHNTTG